MFGILDRWPLQFIPMHRDLGGFIFAITQSSPTASFSADGLDVLFSALVPLMQLRRLER
jgi:hypothetical protein